MSEQTYHIEKKEWSEPELIVIPFNQTKGGGPDDPPEDYDNNSASP